jgi:hypothetical protein
LGQIHTTSTSTRVLVLRDACPFLHVQVGVGVVLVPVRGGVGVGVGVEVSPPPLGVVVRVTGCATAVATPILRSA